MASAIRGSAEKKAAMLHFDTETAESACCTRVGVARKWVKRLWLPEWRKDGRIEIRNL